MSHLRVVPFLVVGFAVSLLGLGLARGQTCTDLDGDGWTAEPGCPNSGDCNDQNPAIHPGAIEICNGFDDNCDGSIDEECDTVCSQAERIVSSDSFSSNPDDRSFSWNGKGYGVVVSYFETGIGEQIHFVRTDPNGNQVGADRRLTSGSDSEQTPDIAWSGKEYGIVWGGFYAAAIYFQRLSSDGTPLSPTLRVNPNPSYGVGRSRIVWSGTAYGMCWDQADISGPTNVRFALVDVDGMVLTPPGGLVVSTGSKGSGCDIAWSGKEFAVVWQDQHIGNDNVFLTRYSADGVRLPGDAAVSTTRGYGNARVSWGPGEWGVTWEDVDGDQEFRPVSAEGATYSFPLKVASTIYWDASGDLTWSGGEYGHLYLPLTAAPDSDIYLGRFDGIGTVAQTVTMTDPVVKVSQGYVAWSGKDYGVLTRNKTGGLSIYRLGCHCGDLDGDGYSSCGGKDCNDADPRINPGAKENCSDLIDNNCDGLVDCNDTVACAPKGGSPPGEVTGDRFLGKSSYTWNLEPSSTRYDVARGAISELRMGSGLYFATCFLDEVPGPPVMVTEIPLVGDGFYYLVRGVKGQPAACLRGTWGSAARDTTAVRSCP